MYKIYLWFENSHTSYTSDFIPIPGDIFNCLKLQELDATRYVVDRRIIHPGVLNLITIILKKP